MTFESSVNIYSGEEKIHYREIKIVMRIKSRQRSITTSYRPLIRSLSNCRENSAACYIGIAERSLSTNRARSLRNEMNWAPRLKQHDRGQQSWTSPHKCLYSLRINGSALSAWEANVTTVKRAGRTGARNFWLRSFCLSRNTPRRHANAPRRGVGRNIALRVEIKASMELGCWVLL